MPGLDCTRHKLRGRHLTRVYSCLRDAVRTTRPQGRRRRETSPGRASPADYRWSKRLLGRDVRRPTSRLHSWVETMPEVMASLTDDPVHAFSAGDTTDPDIACPTVY